MPQKTTDYVDGESVIWKASICQEYNYLTSNANKH